MKKSNGVVIKLKSAQKGVRLTFAAKVLKIALQETRGRLFTGFGC